MAISILRSLRYARNDNSLSNTEPLPFPWLYTILSTYIMLTFTILTLQMIEPGQYKVAFCEKYTPWLKEKWENIPLFRQWVDLQAYLKEPTHGLEHSATVRATAYHIGQHYLQKQYEQIDETVLDMMAIFHDIARHARYPSDRDPIKVNSQGMTKKEKHTQRFVFPHELTGAAIARVVCKRVICEGDDQSRNLLVMANPKVFRQLLSHDYHSPEVTPYTHAPQTLEAQVFCVADKTSMDPVREVQRRYRYLTTRVNNPVPLLDPGFPMEERRRWRFEMAARDALCAIIPIFSFYPTFTSSEGLKQYYQDWSTNLELAAEEVLLLAEKEGGKVMKDAVNNILEAFKIA